jgi:hypothetical protein
MEGWKKIYQACRSQKLVGVPILLSDKADFKQKSDKSDKAGHHILKMEQSNKSILQF